MLRRALLSAALALGLAGWAMAKDQPVTVMAAASLKNVLDDEGAAFTKAGGPPVRLSYAASSAIARQVESGAPADVFVSADVEWMDYVASKGLILKASRANLVTNHLALVAPVGSRLRLRLDRGAPLAQALGDGRLAIAAPEVPAGKYGRAALVSLGGWDSVKDHLVSTENVRAALLFVSRGEAPLGIVYDTDAKSEPKGRIVDLFPETSHPPIVYPGAVLAASKNPAAGRFLAFLRSGQGHAIFRKYGFTPLP